MSVLQGVQKLMRWVNIWGAQFLNYPKENRRCEVSNKVLLIKLDAIGDFIIWLDSAKEYKNIYPEQSLFLLCNEACASIARSTGYFDEIITLNIRRFESDRKYMKEKLSFLAGYEFGVLIQTAYSRTIHMDILAKSIKATEKIGMVCDESRINLSRYIMLKKYRVKFDEIYDRLISVPGEYLMEIKRNGQFVNGISSYSFESAVPIFPRCEIDKTIIPKGDYYILFPGSSTPKKMWKLSHYTEVAEYIYKKTGWIGYVCGNKNESHLYDEIKTGLGEQVKLVNMCGSTSLIELAEVIRGAKLVVSNDTSGIHYAAATNTPSVCISGEYHIGRFLPYDYDKKDDSEYVKNVAPMIVCTADMACKKCAGGKLTKECRKSLAKCGRYLCMEKVSAEMVERAVDKVIGAYDE